VYAVKDNLIWKVPSQYTECRNKRPKNAVQTEAWKINILTPKEWKLENKTFESIKHLKGTHHVPKGLCTWISIQRSIHKTVVYKESNYWESEHQTSTIIAILISKPDIVKELQNNKKNNIHEKVSIHHPKNSARP
jgi:hypothetical protein